MGGPGGLMGNHNQLGDPMMGMPKPNTYGQINSGGFPDPMMDNSRYLSAQNPNL